jgi:hypothetical protein
MDDDIEELLDLSLELEFLRRGGGHGRFSCKVERYGRRVETQRAR